MNSSSLKIAVVSCIAFNQFCWFYLLREYNKSLNEINNRYTRVHNVGKYMLHLLEENHIDLNEFDEIALRLLTEDDNASKR